MNEPGPLLLGIDVGTTHVKAALVGLDGRLIRTARRPTPSRTEPDGGTVHPIEALLVAVEGAIGECADAAPPGRPIEAVGIAGMAEAGTAVAADGRPLAEVIAWFDPRPGLEAQAIEKEIGAGPLFEATGLRPERKYSLAKLLWLLATRPEIRAIVRGWAGVPELVAHHLTGVLATTPSLACRTLAFDLRRRAWHPDLLGLAGLGPEDMPPILEITEPAGHLGREIAFRVGLPTGVSVAIAGHDHLVGAFGAGVVEPGMVLDSLGTAEAVLAVTAEPLLDDAVRRAGYSIGAHVAPDRHYVIAGMPAGGALVDWFVTTFLSGPGGPAAKDDRYGAFLELLETPISQPSGIVVDPSWRGRTAPSPDADARGTIQGIGMEHGLADLALATIEGLACNVRWMLEGLEALSGRPIERVRLIGGGLENRHFVDIKAAVGPWPLEASPNPEAVAVGAALVGAVAGGLLSVGEALGRVAPGRAIDVDPELAGAYERFYRDGFLPLVTRDA